MSLPSINWEGTLSDKEKIKLSRFQEYISFCPKCDCRDLRIKIHKKGLECFKCGYFISAEILEKFIKEREEKVLKERCNKLA